MSEITVLGIDPDTNATGFAVVKGFPGGVEVIEKAVALADFGDIRERIRTYPKKIFEAIKGCVALSNPEITLAVIESQMVRPGDKRPDNICQLAKVEGICLAECWHHIDAILTPLPVQWKGTMSKESHQKMIRARVGIPGKICGVPDRYATHVLDAIGLALWGIDQWAHNQNKQRLLAWDGVK